MFSIIVNNGEGGFLAETNVTQDIILQRHLLLKMYPWYVKIQSMHSGHTPATILGRRRPDIMSAKGMSCYFHCFPLFFTMLLALLKNGLEARLSFSNKSTLTRRVGRVYKSKLSQELCDTIIIGGGGSLGKNGTCFVKLIRNCRELKLLDII